MSVSLTLQSPMSLSHDPYPLKSPISDNRNILLFLICFSYVYPTTSIPCLIHPTFWQKSPILDNRIILLFLILQVSHVCIQQALSLVSYTLHSAKRALYKEPYVRQRYLRRTPDTPGLSRVYPQTLWMCVCVLSPVSRALHSLKRALYYTNISLLYSGYSMSFMCVSKEPYPLSHEPSSPSKEPYIPSKEP